MSGRPNIFMPFYVADYLAATGHLSAQEHGSYLLLLFHYWRTGKRLPDDDTRLARISRQSVTEWATVSVTVRAFFDPINEDGQPVLMNKKLEEVLLVATDRMARQKAASAKANKAKAEAAARLAGKPPAKKRSKTASDPVTETVSESGLKAHTHTEDKNSPSTKENSTAPSALVPVVPMVLKIELPTNTGKMFPISDDQFDAWEELYPSVDVMAELRKMRGWLDASPKRRKTAGGMLKFANAWLARQQDEGRPNAQPARQSARRPAAHSRLIEAAADTIRDLAGGDQQILGAGDAGGDEEGLGHAGDPPGAGGGAGDREDGDLRPDNHAPHGAEHPLLDADTERGPRRSSPLDEIEIPGFLLRPQRGNGTGDH